MVDRAKASCTPNGFTYAADIFHASVYTMSPGTTKISVDKPTTYDEGCSFVKVRQYKHDYVLPTAPSPVQTDKDCVEVGDKRLQADIAD